MAGRPKAESNGPKRRPRLIRVPKEVARRVRDGHPWVFSEALRGQALSCEAGAEVDVHDADGHFVARAVYDPDETVALRVFSRTPGRQIDAAYVRERLLQALALRRRLLAPAPSDCYRLVNGDSEGFPGLTVDRFGAFVLLGVYARTAGYLARLVAEVLPTITSVAGIYVQDRYRPQQPSVAKPASELLYGTPAPAELVVSEPGFRCVLDMTAPGNPGIYTDMRLGRRRVHALSAGRRVANCFSYTGAFSVVAALGGATTVLSIDSSSRAHGRARRNFGENGLDPGSDRFEFITGDAFVTLERATSRGQAFDLIVLDPPTFSSGPGRKFTAIKDYADLMAVAAAAIAPQGIICAASNAAKLPQEEFERAIGRGADRAGRRAVITDWVGLPPDFPTAPAFSEANYLKFAVTALD